MLKKLLACMLSILLLAGVFNPGAYYVYSASDINGVSEHEEVDEVDRLEGIERIEGLAGVEGFVAVEGLDEYEKLETPFAPPIANMQIPILDDPFLEIDTGIGMGINGGASVNYVEPQRPDASSMNMAAFSSPEPPQPGVNGFISPIEPVPSNILPENIVYVATQSQLADIGGIESEGKYYVLTKDINLSGDWTPIDDFYGVLDGQGYSIINLNILAESQRNNAGLFSTLEGGREKFIEMRSRYDESISDWVEYEYYEYAPIGVEVKNLGIEPGAFGIAGTHAAGSVAGIISHGVRIFNVFSNSYNNNSIIATTYAGGLVGMVDYTLIDWGESATTISDSYSTINAKASTAGGLVGYNRAFIMNSFSSGDIEASYMAGGLIGCAEYGGKITNTYAAGNIISTSYEAIYAGGLAGYSNCMIEDSYAAGNVSAQSSNGTMRAGGLVGINHQNIIGCYAVGNVTAQTASVGGVYVGGLGGYGGAYISNSYATGEVRGTSTGNTNTSWVHAGGLVGYISYEVINCYASGDVFITANNNPSYACGGAGGLVGVSNDTDIVNSYATGNATSTAVGSIYSGGLVGAFNVEGGSGYAILTNSYATGNASSTSTSSSSYYSSSGGLIGFGLSNTIINNYATGNAVATGTNARAGGLIGGDEGTFNITDSYARGDAKANGATTYAGGLIGNISGTEASHAPYVINSYRHDNQIVQRYNRAGTTYMGGATNTLGDLMRDWLIKQIGELDDKQYYIHVSDNQTGDNIVGASVIINNISKITNDIGVAYFSSTEISSARQSLRISAYGYRTLISEVAPTFGDISIFTLNKPSNEPYIDAILLDTPFKDILKSMVFYSDNSTATIRLDIKGGYDQGILSGYELFQGGIQIASAQAYGTVYIQLKDLALTNANNIYARAVGTDGSLSHLYMLNINIGQVRSSETGVKLSLGNQTNINVPGWIPYFGGREADVDLGFIPLQMSLEGDKFIIGMGVSSDYWERVDDFEKFKNLKNAIDLLDINGSIYNNEQIFNDWEDKLNDSFFELKASVWGYIEGTILDNGLLWNVTNGKIIIAFELEGEKHWQTAIAGYPVVFAFEMDVGAKVSFEPGFDFNKSEMSIYKLLKNTTFTIPANFEFRAGFGLAYILNAGGYANIGIEFEYKPETKQKSISIDGTAGFYIETCYIFTYKWPFPASVTWKWPQDNAFSQLQNELFSDNISIYDSSNYTISSRDYLANQSSWLGDNINIMQNSSENIRILQSSVFTQTEPLIAQVGDKRVMIFITDDGSRGTYDRTKLVYSVFDQFSDSWSLPIAVADDGKADYFPFLYSDGTDIFVAWNKSNKIFGNDTTMDEFFAASEVYTAKFDIATSMFINSFRITNNTSLDIKPKIASYDGKMIAAWMYNDENDMFGMNGINAIFISEYNGTYWETPRSIVNTVKTIVDISVDYYGGKPIIAYIVDNDNDMSTIDDKDLIVTDLEGLSLTIIKDEYVSNLISSDILGNKSLSWYQNNNIHYSSDIEIDNIATLFPEDKVYLTDNYKIISDDFGNSIILYSATDNGCGAMYAYIYDRTSGKWGDSVKILELSEKQFMQYFDALIDDNNNLFIVFNNASIIVDNDYITENNDLCSAIATSFCDIKLKDTFYNPYDANPGTDFPITLRIINNGLEKISGFILEAKINNQVIDTVYVNHNIIPGETAEIDTSFMLPSNIGIQTEITINVTPQGYTDENIEDNSSTIIIGFVDLELSIEDYYYDNNRLIIKTLTKNIGNYTTGARLIIRKDNFDGPIIDDINIGTVEDGANFSILVNLDTSSFDYNNLDKGVLCFEVVSSDEELLTGNNKEFIPIYKPIYMMNLKSSEGGLVAGIGGYVQGSTVNVVAAPLDGYWFDGWYENGRRLVDAGAAYSFVAVADRNLEARFVVAQAAVPVVDTVVIAPSAVTLAQGGAQQFSAVVNGTNDPPQEVAWSVAVGGGGAGGGSAGGGGTGGGSSGGGSSSGGSSSGGSSGGVAAGTSISASGLLTIAADEIASILQVTATSTYDNTKTGTATVTVIPSQAYAIQATTMVNFYSLQAPYKQPSAQTVTITNTGANPITLTQPTSYYYEIGPLSTRTLASKGATATFAVRPKADLPFGSYNEKIRIDASNGIYAIVEAYFMVVAAPSTGNENDGIDGGAGGGGGGGDGDGSVDSTGTNEGAATSNEEEQQNQPAYKNIRDTTRPYGAINENIVYIPFINGYPDGTFMPDNPIYRSELAQIIYNLYGGGSGGSVYYSDMDQTHWAYKAVGYCYHQGYMSGYPSGEFKPDQAVTRAEICAVIARVKNLIRTTNHPFPDIGDHWAIDEIGAASAAGLVLGYPDGTFRPDNSVTRAEAVTMICRAEQRVETLFDIKKEFSDLISSYWGYDYIMNAANGYNYFG